MATEMCSFGFTEKKLCASFRMGVSMSLLQKIFSNKITPLIQAPPISQEVIPQVTASAPSVVNIRDPIEYHDSYLFHETTDIGIATIHSSSMERQYATSENHLQL
jgi:hypothetical protein